MNEYFEPKKEDLRLGYEYEEFLPAWDKWESRKINELCNDRDGMGGFAQAEFLIDFYPKYIRVKFLTKEQIEAEGWKAESQTLNNYLRGIKKCSVKQGRMGHNWDYNIPVEFQFTYDTKNCILKIMYISLDDLTWFEGECKDINTFRYICKLLNI